MGLMTGGQYRESLGDGRRVWIEGERVPDVTKHPAFAGMIDAVARIYDMQHEAEFAEALTFAGADGNRRSRFYKLPTAREELTLRRRMTLTVLDEVSPVMDRFGDETVTPLFVLADRKATLDRYDKRYAANVMGWLDELERTNLFMTSGNTDLKGDRSKQPYQQPDLDAYLRVV
jgi:4-hydroxyphenylacetate 3-monooxygenase